MKQMSNKTVESPSDVILTGDRPTGPLHLGHYVGSLLNRVSLQETHQQFVMIADIQALTDYYDKPDKVHNAVIQVLADYLAVGIDPCMTTIFIQSLIPEIAELTILYLNLVTVNRLRRNPTIKTEMQQKGIDEHVSAGFLMYPVSQAADITIVQATLVPVGEDQLPVIEQTNEIVRDFNRIYHTTVLREAKPLIARTSRLPGIDGKSKMSKSLGNAIYLSDSEDTVSNKVKLMYTDPNHLRVSDPGVVEGNTVFTYLDAFDPDHQEVAALKEKYRHGGLGDMVLKKRLTEILNDILTPIRTRRELFMQDPSALIAIAREGSERTREVTEHTMHQVREAIKLVY